MRIKELGTRFDTEGTTCASCGAPKSKKGGLGNCYGCGKLFCSSCREKSFSFKVEEEELSVNVRPLALLQHLFVTVTDSS